MYIQQDGILKKQMGTLHYAKVPKKKKHVGSHGYD